MSLIENPELKDAYRVNEQDFTRQSTLGFSVIVRSILHLFKESVEHNLHCLIPELANDFVTGSAFTQARYKVKPTFFKLLEQFVVSHYNQVEKRKWKGHRLIGVDGSTLNLPPSKDIKTHFGIRAINDKGINRSLARVSLFYDLLNDFVVENAISPMGIGEKKHLFDRLDQIEDQNDIYILDRGYGHYNTVLSLINKEKKFCIRFSATSNFIRNILSSKEKDQIVIWQPSAKEIENAKKQGLKAKPITIRVTKVVLNTGETEVLVSNLININWYTSKDMKWLYQKRWVVEEGFKKMKPKMKIEYFGCRKTAGIYQEFYAHVFMMNIVAFLNLICHKKVTETTKTRKYEYKTNWQNSFRITRRNIISLTSHDFSIHELEKILHIIMLSLIPIIPDKVAIRDLRHKNKRGRISHYYK